MTLRFLAKATSAESGTLYVYDQVGADPWFGGGVGSKQIIEALAGLKSAKTLSVRINSPGGSVHEGVAIFNTLKAWAAEHPGGLTVHIDALAASIASVIAMAGDKIVMASNALMMIHEAHGIARGPAEEMRKSADLLEKVNASMVETYSARTKQPAEKLKQWMADTRWMNAEEAKADGFIDEIGGAVDETTAAAAPAIFAHYKNVPTRAAGLAALQITAAAEPPPTPTQSPQEKNHMDRTALIALLGLAAESTDAQIAANISGLKGLSGELTALTGKSTVAESLGVLHAHKQAASKTAHLEAELAKVAAAQLESERANLIAQGNKEGKLPPGMNAWAQSCDLASLKSFLAAASPVVQLAAVPQAPSAPSALTDSDKKMARQSRLPGQTDEQAEASFATEKARLAARRS